ncbi:MAG: MvaI/BcnI restriction endonuclease family protein [Candidatus Cloacimonetes bacterium]|nr:MvaI/BcnI restriction endonuclease family protein [Candidatus Cloacimonadota bacterium]
MEIFTKNHLINELIRIKESGWIKNARIGNVGGIGNTLEDLLGIEENNLPIPNASEWELKTQRKNTSSLTTLFHMEPSPRAFRFVPQIFLLNYGWKHKEAGLKYPQNEMSFRQTIGGNNRSDRGFKVVINRDEQKVLISFDANSVSDKHSDWLKSVEERIGLNELTPQPYWGFNDLFHKAGTKLLNCFYIQAEVKRIEGVEYFHYTDIMMLQDISLDKFLLALEKNDILVDFDARTGHNHGTKFRLKQNKLPDLYDNVTII